MVLAIPTCFLGILAVIWHPLTWPMYILGLAILTLLQARHHLIDKRFYSVRMNAWAWKVLLWVSGNGIFTILYWIVVNGPRITK